MNAPDMKWFVLSWEEYLPAAMSSYQDMEILCSGESLVKAEDRNDARRVWKRLFPRSKINSLLEKPIS